MNNYKKKAHLGGGWAKKGTTALICNRNYTAFRISCIMLILAEINNKITTTAVTKSYIKV